MSYLFEPKFIKRYRLFKKDKLKSKALTDWQVDKLLAGGCDLDRMRTVRFNQVSSPKRMPLNFFVPRVMNEYICGRIWQRCHTLTNDEYWRFSKTAHTGRLFLLTVGIYKKWPDTDDGYKVTAYAKSCVDAALWINP